jgi:hypothetical protein
MPVPAPDLDAWLPSPAIRTRHRRAASAPPASLWEAAESVRWRLPGTGSQTTYRDLFSGHPFIVLAEGEHWSISGLAGRIWTLQHDYARLDDPEEFRAWDEGGTARVLFAHWVEPAPGGSALLSEARVDPVGRRAAVRLRALWTVVGPFERLIGGEALSLAAGRAAR